MTKRTDIIDGQDIRTPNGAFKKYGLIYTKYAGWIDLGHANPASASSLWGDITTSTTSWMCLNRPNELVTIMYKQSMRKWGVERGITQRYGLAKQLTVDEQRSIALAIFMDVSIAFEGFQSSWPYNWVTDSGFSMEDLVSNLLGFYRALHPHIDYITPLEPVSKEQSLRIWDEYGAVGHNKNTTFKPTFYPDPLMQCGIAATGRLPHAVDTIKPAAFSSKFVQQ
jgi:Protein of unknown function (DUF4056)